MLINWYNGWPKVELKGYNYAENKLSSILK